MSPARAVGPARVNIESENAAERKKRMVTSVVYRRNCSGSLASELYDLCCVSIGCRGLFSAFPAHNTCSLMINVMDPDQSQAGMGLRIDHGQHGDLRRPIFH